MHDRGDTSGKHEAIIANKDQRKSLALVRRTPPGFFCFSQVATRANSSTGVTLPLSLPDISLHLIVDDEVVIGSVLFFTDCILLRTVNTWSLSRGSPNSDTYNIICRLNQNDDMRVILK